MKTGKILLHTSLVTLAVALTTGCANQKSWVYHPNSYPAAIENSGEKVAILPFEDARSNENHNMWGMYLIPLMPFGWQDFSTPEGMQMHMNSGMWINYKPTEDFPKALAEDLRNTGLFSDAYFDFRQEGSDFVVKGKILNTQYNGRIITYGLSVYGPDLWIIGFPATWTENQLSLELGLVNSKTAKTLFSKSYTVPPEKRLSWLYVIKNDFEYPDMLRELNKEFCQDIKPVVLEAAKQQQAQEAAVKAQAEAIKQQQAREEAARQQQAREEAIKQQQAQEQAAKQAQAEAAKAQAEAATQQPTNATGPQEPK